MIEQRPMWEISKMPTLFRTAKCSGIIPLYHMGISKPAKTVNLAVSLCTS